MLCAPSLPASKVLGDAPVSTYLPSCHKHAGITGAHRRTWVFYVWGLNPGCFFLLLSHLTGPHFALSKFYRDVYGCHNKMFITWLFAGRVYKPCLLWSQYVISSVMIQLGPTDWCGGQCLPGRLHFTGCNQDAVGRWLKTWPTPHGSLRMANVGPYMG